MENKTRDEQMLPNCGEKGFFAGQSREILQAVCRGMDGERCPTVHVSEQLMVLGQTKAGGELFADAVFYSIESFLTRETGELIRQCMAQHTEQEQQVQLEGRQWNMRIMPVCDGAVLVFTELRHGSAAAGVTLAASNLRERALGLLFKADDLDKIREHDMAAEIRREAFRILRSANHLELLAGAPEYMRWGEHPISAFIKELQKQLERQRVDVSIAPLPHDANMQADAHLLRAAILSLVSNSLQHGGKPVHVRISVELTENNVTFRVDDDGIGIPDAVMQRMNNTWEQRDALPGGWGLGIPYVRRIAMMHQGLLVYVRAGETGTHARLRIPLQQDESVLLESGGAYQRVFSDASNEADIELSTALDATHFRRD